MAHIKILCTHFRNPKLFRLTLLAYLLSALLSNALYNVVH